MTVALTPCASYAVVFVAVNWGVLTETVTVTGPCALDVAAAASAVEFPEDEPVTAATLDLVAGEAEAADAEEEEEDDDETGSYWSVTLGCQVAKSAPSCRGRNSLLKVSRRAFKIELALRQSSMLE